jgi:indoleamine 2,3-dioxygenase
MDPAYARRGFLPEADPAAAFPPGTELARLDQLGRDLPSLLHDPGSRAYLRAQPIPPFDVPPGDPAYLPLLRLYYVRLGFLASGYINQVGQPPETVLPRNLAEPLVGACRRLGRPPILSYDGYALYNWRRFDPAGPIALGNIDTHQNFVHLYDERWFILVHVAIEAIAARVLDGIGRAADALAAGDDGELDAALGGIAGAVWDMVGVLRRIPEKMDPAVYYRAFRPYIRFFENVVYEGVTDAPVSHRGETGAQSSIMPALVAFLKIPHRPSLLTDHLADMRAFMPAEHRAVLAEVEGLPPVRPRARKETFNGLLEAVAAFREVHYGWAELYIHQRVSDPRGTGGTPYRQWLRQLIDETHRWKIE